MLEIMATRKTAGEVSSIRLSPALKDELAARRLDSGSRSEAINRFAVEGMRIASHPGIVFRDGPAGRRPALFHGPDVWEVARVLVNSEVRGDGAVDLAVEHTGLSREQVTTVVGYYAAYREEVDDWIAMVDEYADRCQREWQEREAILA
jgi:hypothetical protein